MTAFWVGIDENGLGSWLGPLVVTGVMVKSEAPDPADRRKAFQTLGARLLDDSKRLVSHQDVRLGEAWARALIGPRATSPDSLLGYLVLDDIPSMMASCPEPARPQCWTVGNERFLSGDALVEQLRSELAEFGRRGLGEFSVRSALVCTGRLNQALGEGLHRFHLDLHQMERLVLSFSEQAGGSVHAVMGKVGGIVKYGHFFGPLAGHLHQVIEEGRECSTYEFLGLGRLEFRKNADASDPLVMMASLVGKYVRELMMARIGRYYGTLDPSLREPSGYHDSVTRRFVEAAGVHRIEQKVPLDCFLRRGRRDS